MAMFGLKFDINKPSANIQYINKLQIVTCKINGSADAQKMLHRKRSAALKSLVCAAYFPWCLAHKSRHIEPAHVPLSINPWTAPRKTLLLPWSEETITSSECILGEDKTDSSHSKEKIPMNAFTLAQICAFSHWQYFYSMGPKQRCVMRFIKPVDCLAEYHLRLMRSGGNLHISKWTEALEYEFTPYKQPKHCLALYIPTILSQISEVEKNRLFMSCW